MTNTQELWKLFDPAKQQNKDSDGKLSSSSLFMRLCLMKNELRRGLGIQKEKVMFALFLWDVPELLHSYSFLQSVSRILLPAVPGTVPYDWKYSNLKLKFAFN